MRNSANTSASALSDTEINTLIFTHLHPKHTVSFSRLADLYRIKTIVVPINTGTADVSNEIIMKAEEKGISVRTIRVEEGAIIISGRAKTEILSSVPVRNRRHGTISVKISGDKNLLFLSRTALEKGFGDNGAFILSHGESNTEAVSLPADCIAMNTETALSVGLEKAVNPKRDLRLYRIRLEEFKE